jgi:hypothetical protein
MANPASFRQMTAAQKDSIAIYAARAVLQWGNANGKVGQTLPLIRSADIRTGEVIVVSDSRAWVAALTVKRR